MFNHKYIRQYKTQEDVDKAIQDRVFEEVNVSAITGARDTVPDSYQYSTRQTNDDDKVLGKYNALDDISYFGGLEIYWGYWGWQWTDYTLDGETLKGGNFIKLKTTREYPMIYDGYRLQHINNLVSQMSATNLSKSNPFKIGYFDNSNVLAANNAFNMKCVRIDERNNTWNVKQFVNMFKSSFDNFTIFDDNKITDLYFNAPLVNSGPLFQGDYTGVPKLHFHSVEKFPISSIYGITKFYIGNPPENPAGFRNIINDDALVTCYDYTAASWLNSSGNTVYFDVSYTGDNVVKLSMLGVPGKFTFKCHKKWDFRSSSNYLLSSLNSCSTLDIDEQTIKSFDYTTLKSDDKRTLFPSNAVIDFGDDHALKIPLYCFKKYAINLYTTGTRFYNFPLTYEAYRKGHNIPTDKFYEFKSSYFYFSSADDKLVMTGFENYDNLDISFYGRNGSATAYDQIELHLSPGIDTPAYYKSTSFNINNIIKDSHIIYDGTGVSGWMTVPFNINYDNVKVGIKSISTVVEIGGYMSQYGIINNYRTEEYNPQVPEVYSIGDVTPYSNWFNDSAISSYCREIHMSGLTLTPRPKEQEPGSPKIDHICMQLPNHEHLTIVEMPVLLGQKSLYRLNKAQNLDIPSLFESLRRQETLGDNKVTFLYINRVIYDKMTEEQQTELMSLCGSLYIYENEV